MVRQPDATMQPTPQDNQLMSKHRVLSFKPQLRLEWRGQDGQSETEQPQHSASVILKRELFWKRYSRNARRTRIESEYVESIVADGA
jgi:hypothetical protein